MDHSSLFEVSRGLQLPYQLLFADMKINIKNTPRMRRCLEPEMEPGSEVDRARQGDTTYRSLLRCATPRLPGTRARREGHT